jgi:putative transposase
MARKWSNLNLPGALHFVTGNFLDRIPVFTDPECCKAFLDELQKLIRNWPSKLITYVLMPDHLHLIANPRDGRIKEFTGQLKAVSAKAMVRTKSRFVFPETDKGHQVWQESFKDVALWSGWMIWQKINYIPANAVKAGLV